MQKSKIIRYFIIFRLTNVITCVIIMVSISVYFSQIFLNDKLKS